MGRPSLGLRMMEMLVLDRFGMCCCGDQLCCCRTVLAPMLGAWTIGRVAARPGERTTSDSILAPSISSVPCPSYLTGATGMSLAVYLSHSASSFHDLHLPFQGHGVGAAARQACTPMRHTGEEKETNRPCVHLVIEPTWIRHDPTEHGVSLGEHEVFHGGCDAGHCRVVIRCHLILSVREEI